MILIFDIAEFLAVFLLAIEAIKLNNIDYFVQKKLKPFYTHVNPPVVFVDDTSHLGWRERHAFDIFALLLYLIGAGLLAFWNYHYELNAVSAFYESEILYKALFGLAALLIPFLVGFAAYQLLVWALEFSVYALVWIQQKTHNGVVGIIGFVLFAIQFWGRRVLLS